LAGTTGADAIYIGHAEQAQEPPYITIESAMIDHYGKKDGGRSVIKENYSIFTYARSYSEGKAVVEQVEAALDYVSSGQYNGQTVSSARLVSEDHYSIVEPNNEYWLFRQEFEVVLSADTVTQVGTSVAAILLTQAQYDGLGSYESNTYYLIQN